MPSKEEFKKLWKGRKFMCLETKQQLVIPDNVHYGEFFSFGKCFIDVGDEYYSRWGGSFIELFDEDGK